LSELKQLHWERQLRRSGRESLSRYTEEALGYTPDKHHRLLIDCLEKVERGEIKRLMVLQPPGSSKSTYCSVAFPTWYLGRHQQDEIIAASYAQALSSKFGRRCRNVVSSLAYRRIFGVGLLEDSQARDDWALESGGTYYATSVDGSVTGRRANGAVIDDPIKGRAEADSQHMRELTWDWYIHDLLTRLKPDAWIVLVMTRWHEDDPAGRILPDGYTGQSGWLLSRTGEPWYVLCLKAECEDEDDPLGREIGEWLWPEYWPAGFLEKQKGEQGPRDWAALYQQRPAPDEGAYFKREWFRYYDIMPARNTLKVYGASDYATSSADDADYTVHLVAGVTPEDDIYILDLWRQKTDTNLWIEEFLNLAEFWKPDAWAEENGQIIKSVGPFIKKRAMERKVYCWRRQFTSAVDKEARARTIQARMSMGKVYFPRLSPWREALESELLTFPAGKFDDQVDGLSLLGRMLADMLTGKIPPSPKPFRPDLEAKLPTMDQIWTRHEKALKGRRSIG
jgi:predicted phage terminase large subunit-like protein